MADDGFTALVDVYRRADRTVKRARSAAGAVLFFAAFSLFGAVVGAGAAVTGDDLSEQIAGASTAFGGAVAAALLWALSAGLDVLASQLEVAAADTDDE